MLDIEIITGKSVDEIRRVPNEKVGLVILLEHYEHSLGKKRIVDIDKIVPLIDESETEGDVHIIGNPDNVADLVIALTMRKPTARVHVYLIIPAKDLGDNDYLHSWSTFLYPCLKSGALNRRSAFTLISDDRIGDFQFNYY